MQLEERDEFDDDTLGKFSWRYAEFRDCLLSKVGSTRKLQDREWLLYTRIVQSRECSRV